MSFRRRGKLLHDDAMSWKLWKEQYSELILQCGFPPTVMRSRADWQYVLRFGYHCEPCYPHIDFRIDEMTPEQQLAVARLLDQTLTTEEKLRGNALWRPRS